MLKYPFCVVWLDIDRKEPSGTFPILFIVSIKSPKSGMYDQPLCITGFKWKSRNSDALSVGIPQFEITGFRQFT